MTPDRAGAGLTEAQIEAISERAEKATPGPWHPRHTDDEACMNAYYVGLDPAPDARPYPKHDTRLGLAQGGEDQEPSNRVVAITLLQAPRLADIGDENAPETCCWEENTDFIAHARTDVPDLVAAVRALQETLAVQITRGDRYWAEIDRLNAALAQARDEARRATARAEQLAVEIAAEVSGMERDRDRYRAALEQIREIYLEWIAPSAKDYFDVAVAALAGEAGAAEEGR